MEEPSVLDYIKALLTPWKGKPPAIPGEGESIEQPAGGEPAPAAGDEESLTEPNNLPGDQVGEPAGKAKRLAAPIPWRSGIAFLLALIAQFYLEPPDQRVSPAVILYGFSLAFIVFAIVRKEWVVPEYLDERSDKRMSVQIQRKPLFVAIPLLLLAFVLFGWGDRYEFSALNLVLWVAGGAGVVLALWDREEGQVSLWARVKGFVRHPGWTFRISTWTVLVGVIVAGILFFRFYRLDQVPGEMFSDHAEKLLDVADVLQGKLYTFFPRNTGREAIQMYLTALVGMVFGSGLSFMSLKIGTALAGVLSLPYIYLLGKEIGGRWVGLTALLLAGIAYWPNVISRIGLRFPLYPLFVAPTLFYLIRGLRYRQRNDFIWAGIALGLGLHGYSPTRFLPFVVVAAVILYLVHRQSQKNRQETISALVLLAMVSLVVFLPLLRYALSEPQMFGYRALSRLAETESQYTAPAVIIFFQNLWKSLIMFFYNNGNIWVHSVTSRPALDVVTAASYFLGTVLVLVRYLQKRNWLDLFLLVSVPLLMMPSILSLAFPDENPSLNRSGGAIVPVFILAAIGLTSLVKTLRKRFSSSGGMIGVAGLTAILLFISLSANYDLVFRQFDRQFMGGAWNTSQIGGVIRGFSQSQGNAETAYVIPYPHWVDTRLVGINAGYPLRDYALGVDQIETTLAEPRAKLFVLNTQHTEAVQKVQDLYPNGSLYLYDVELEGKDFLLYFVPPADSISSPVEQP